MQFLFLANSPGWLYKLNISNIHRMFNNNKVIGPGSTLFAYRNLLLSLNENEKNAMVKRQNKRFGKTVGKLLSRQMLVKKKQRTII